MQAIHGRKQKNGKRHTENVTGGLECSTGDGKQHGHESNEASNSYSSWRDTHREEGLAGGQAVNGGMLRQLKAIKKSLLAHTDTNRQILEEGIRKNEEYRQEVLDSIDALENKITSILAGDEEVS